MKFSVRLPFEAIYILAKLKQADFDSYLVGGAVRDTLLNSLNIPETDTVVQEITDFDFTTDAQPNQIQELFAESFYTNEFGTVGIGYENLLNQIESDGLSLPEENIKSRLNRGQKKPEPFITLEDISKVHQSLQKNAKKIAQKLETKPEIPPPFEITTYRSEGVYRDYRRPTSVEWGKSIEQDLERRDFTINAMALTVNEEALSSFLNDSHNLSSVVEFSPKQYQLVDEHQGLTDLNKHLIRTVRSPDERFSEDALRMLRAVRFAVQLKMEIEELTLESIRTNAMLITNISWERISGEFLKMLASDQPDRAIELLDETGLLSFILPELKKTKKVEQGGHHTTDVWVHTLDSLANCPSKDPIVRLAVLLHDIGKPQTYKVREGEITFYNHEIVSSHMADKIGKRFKLSNQQRERLCNLVRHHMFYYQPNHSDAAVRRMIKRIGIENIDDILAMREADRVGSGVDKTSWRLEELKQRIIEQLNQPFDLTDLAIDGGDLIQELNLKPGPIIGQILDELMNRVLANPNLNKKDRLVAEAKELKKDLEK